jgi:hypothetical protein
MRKSRIVKEAQIFLARLGTTVQIARTVEQTKNHVERNPHTNRADFTPER